MYVQLQGICGLPETIESKRSLDSKVSKLISLIQQAKYITVITGAGISTSAGIPDFRGPNGIWTKENLEKKKAKSSAKANNKTKKRKLNDEAVADCTDTNARTATANAPPAASASFETAKPTLTHRAITKLAELDIIKYCITQNVDGLHMRSGIPRSKYSFLHGCIFTEKCESCQKEYFRDYDIGGVSFKTTGRKCQDCKGALRDTILDWEDELPEEDWIRAQEECSKSDLVLALGTSLRIEPAGSLPTLGKKFVIVNKQVTPYDGKAALILRAPVDQVFERVMAGLDCVAQDWDDE